jgi:CubicO group peptidase (beta-lactamase class C family)
MPARFLALLLALATAPATAATSRLDLALAALAGRGEFDGAVAIMRGDELAFARGYGLADLGPPLPFAPDTIVETGSIAKPITAAAVLLLARQGRVELDAPVRRYVAEFPDAAATVRQLLAHSAGLPDYGAFDAELNSGRVIRTADLLGFIRARGAAPPFAPGTGFSYCNICYDTLALLVERVSGRDYESFVLEQLLRPAGVRQAFLRPARLVDWRGRRIRGFRRTTGGIRPNDVFDNEGFYGGGNLYFSARDLVAWASAWAIGGEAAGALRPAATEAVMLANGRSGLRLGNWYCDEIGTRCYYPGHHQGFHAFAYWDSRRRIAIAFVSNGTLSPQLQVEIPRLLIAAAEGRGPPAACERGAGANALEAGTYVLPAIGRVTLAGTAEAPTLRAPSGVDYGLFPAGDGAYYAPGLDAYLRRDGARLHWSSVFACATGRAVRDERDRPRQTG